MRKPAFSICENKEADQLLGNREADQRPWFKLLFHLYNTDTSKGNTELIGGMHYTNERPCFRYTDSTIPLLPKSEISSLQPSSVAVQPGLCRTWSETPKTGFLTTRLICKL